MGDKLLALIQGGSRVDKYRHLAYQWLGVDKTELAVIAELLLRGEQTIGQLRGRAARMEPIEGVPQLRPILDQLHTKGLLEYLTPMGRGCIVTHTLFQPEEMNRRRREHQADQTAPSTPAGMAPPTTPELPRPQQHAAQTSSQRGTDSREEMSKGQADEIQSLQTEVGLMRAQLTELREQFESTTSQLQDELNDLKQQLGV